MTPEGAAVVTRIERSLAAAGFAMSEGDIAGRPAVIGRTSEFRLRWMATRLHTFVMVATFSGEDATPEVLDAFLNASVQHSIVSKAGAPRGFQTGTCAVAVAVAESAVQAGDWAVRPHGRRFAAMSFPVLVDVAERRVTHPVRMAVGGVYLPHLKRLVQEHVVPAVG